MKTIEYKLILLRISPELYEIIDKEARKEGIMTGPYLARKLHSDYGIKYDIRGILRSGDGD